MAFKGLFIGIDRYASDGINWLSCARRDAAALHGLFTEPLAVKQRFLRTSRRPSLPSGTSSKISPQLVPTTW